MGLTVQMPLKQEELDIPRVKGPLLLVAQQEVEEKTHGGIIVPQKAREDAEFLTNVGKVVAMGDEAYQEAREGDRRFLRPWCKVGDYVVWSKFTGQRLTYKDRIYVILNDDQVLMTVDDPDFVRPDLYKIKYKPQNV